MKKSIYNFFEVSIFVLFLFLSLVLAVNQAYSVAVIDGIKLWLYCVVPSLFPYFFITAILSALKITSKVTRIFSPLMKKVFRVNGAVSYAFFMSLISGYPIGAKLTAELKENGVISPVEATRASALCSTSSPMFMIGSVGGIMFNSPAFGLGLFICHLLSVLCVGIIFSFYKIKEKPTDIEMNFSSNKLDNLLYESAYSSVISCLTVGGLITLFYLFTEVLLSLNILTPFISLGKNEHYSGGLALGLFECTRGLKELSLGGIGLFALPIATFICSFGGLSVIMQSIAFLKQAKIKTAPFFLAKLLMAVIGFVFAIFYTLLFL